MRHRIDTTDWLVIRTVDLECVHCALIWVVGTDDAPAWTGCKECGGKLELLPKHNTTTNRNR